MVRATQQELLERERTQHEKEKQHQNSMDQLHHTISQLEDKVTILVKEEKQLRFVAHRKEEFYLITVRG